MAKKSKPEPMADRATRLQQLGNYVLETLEQVTDWDSSTLDEIAAKAVELKLATCKYDEELCDVPFRIVKD